MIKHKQNLTISLDPETIRKARILAARRSSSVSALVSVQIDLGCPGRPLAALIAMPPSVTRVPDGSKVRLMVHNNVIAPYPLGERILILAQ